MKGKVKKNILLAGANGIIGSHIYSLFRTNYNIFSIVKSFKKDKKQIRVNLNNNKEIYSICSILPKIDALIFLVGLAHTKGKKKDMNHFRKVNFETLKNLLKGLVQFGIEPKKIIFSSTISVYGERMDEQEYFETSFLQPLSPYAKTKVEAENYLRNNYYGRFYILRLAPVYSKNFLLNIHRRTKIFKIFYRIGDGKKKLSLCNILNINIVVEGILEEKVPSGIYNISDKDVYDYHQLLDIQKAKKILIIPVIFIRIVYFLSILTRNIFLTENSIKLITNNIYPSFKINKYVELNNTLDELY
tara:strand:+ start:787 stop:1692 length:906 start_codon:yes stop_codon:yes gene_type:complete